MGLVIRSGSHFASRSALDVVSSASGEEPHKKIGTPLPCATHATAHATAHATTHATAQHMLLHMLPYMLLLYSLLYRRRHDVVAGERRFTV